jgi:prevent-host-death family protein
MDTLDSSDLRDRVADVLGRVADGERFTITVDGLPVAELVPPLATRRASISRNELEAILATHQADPSLRLELAALSSETTQDLDPS